MQRGHHYLSEQKVWVRNSCSKVLIYHSLRGVCALGLCLFVKPSTKDSGESEQCFQLTKIAPSLISSTPVISAALKDPLNRDLCLALARYHFNLSSRESPGPGDELIVKPSDNGGCSALGLWPMEALSGGEMKRLVDLLEELLTRLLCKHTYSLGDRSRFRHVDLKKHICL